MKDIAARELKGHNILAVERFWDSTFWMIEFTVLRPTAYGEPGDEMRLFLTEDGYQSALQSQQRREIKIKRYPTLLTPNGSVLASRCVSVICFFLSRLMNLSPHILDISNARITAIKARNEV